MSNYTRVLAQDLGERVRRVLVTLNTIKNDTPLFVWPRTDRVVCLVDPLSVTNLDQLLSKRAHHQIQTACQGRRVVFTNHRCAVIQVAYFPEPHVELKAMPVDWSKQPSPLHVPIGSTAKGPLWLSIADMDAVLIGGARRMGKTRLLHSWIRALQRGAATQLFLWDGKGGLEFGCYGDQKGVTVAGDLKEALTPIMSEIAQRQTLFKQLGVSSLKEYNARSRATLPYLVFVIDEAAFIPREAEALIVELVARCGAYGVHPIIATQRPDAEIMNGLLRANLSTRIALPVASPGDSKVILGQLGAEKLPKQPGRLLMTWRARLVEAQAFDVDLLDGVGARVAPVTKMTFSPDEQRLVETAIQHCGGFFRIKELSHATGISRDFILDLAKRWELFGYLTAVKTNDRGHRIGREITRALRDLAGFGDSGI